MLMPFMVKVVVVVVIVVVIVTSSSSNCWRNEAMMAVLTEVFSRHAAYYYHTVDYGHGIHL